MVAFPVRRLTSDSGPLQSSLSDLRRSSYRRVGLPTIFHETAAAPAPLAHQKPDRYPGGRDKPPESAHPSQSARLLLKRFLLHSPFPVRAKSPFDSVVPWL